MEGRSCFWVKGSHIRNIRRLRLQTVYLVNDGNPAEEIGEGIELLEENGFIAVQIDHNKNLGKGAAVRAGAEASTTPLLIYTDIDIPYRKEDVFRMAQAVHWRV